MKTIDLWHLSAEKDSIVKYTYQGEDGVWFLTAKDDVPVTCAILCHDDPSKKDFWSTSWSDEEDARMVLDESLVARYNELIEEQHRLEKLIQKNRLEWKEYQATFRRRS